MCLHMLFFMNLDQFFQLFSLVASASLLHGLSTTKTSFLQSKRAIKAALTIWSSLEQFNAAAT